MATSNPMVSVYLPAHLVEHLTRFQAENGINPPAKSPVSSQAILRALESFFGDPTDRPGLKDKLIASFPDWVNSVD